MKMATHYSNGIYNSNDTTNGICISRSFSDDGSSKKQRDEEEPASPETTSCVMAAIMEAMSAGCEIVVASSQQHDHGALRETLQGFGGTDPFTEDWMTEQALAFDPDIAHCPSHFLGSPTNVRRK